MLTASRILDAIDHITRETGLAPSPDEVAEVFGVSTQSIHSVLLPMKHMGRVGYDENGCFVTRARVAGAPSGASSLEGEQ